MMSDFIILSATHSHLHTLLALTSLLTPALTQVFTHTPPPTETKGGLHGPHLAMPPPLCPPWREADMVFTCQFCDLMKMMPMNLFDLVISVTSCSCTTRAGNHWVYPSPPLTHLCMARGFSSEVGSDCRSFKISIHHTIVVEKLLTRCVKDFKISEHLYQEDEIVAHIAWSHGISWHLARSCSACWNKVDKNE